MNQFLEYLCVTILLTSLLLIYFKIASSYNIVDKPNERSSHSIPTIRGGGIIFTLALVLFSVFHSFSYPYLVFAVLLSGTISFIDDVRSLPNSIRFASHGLSAILLLKEMGYLSLSVFAIVSLVIIVVGMINAYNFMDGINGITGFYSLAVIFPLWISEKDLAVQKLEFYVVIALSVFLFFNARKKARCFAGDVGSIVIAIIAIFLVGKRIAETGVLGYIIFLLLYGLDTGLTVVQRLWNRENIFQAHRKHLFQLLSNELGIAHLKVSIGYASVQLVLNLLFINYVLSVSYMSVVLILGVASYIILKRHIYKRRLGSVI